MRKSKRSGTNYETPTEYCGSRRPNEAEVHVYSHLQVGDEATTTGIYETIDDSNKAGPDDYSVID